MHSTFNHWFDKILVFNLSHTPNTDMWSFVWFCKVVQSCVSSPVPSLPRDSGKCYWLSKQPIRGEFSVNRPYLQTEQGGAPEYIPSSFLTSLKKLLNLDVDKL